RLGWSRSRPGWEEAYRREAAIRDLIQKYPKRLMVAAVDDVAWELGVGRAPMYRLIERYRANAPSRDSSGRGRPPDTLLLPVSIRIPVLAGIAEVTNRPAHWAERLLGAVAETARPRLAECSRRLMAA